MKYLKKIIYILLPITVFIWMDYTANFKGWNTFNLLIRGKVATAEIIENPFHKLTRQFRYNNEIDEDKIQMYIIENNLDKTPLIKFKYYFQGKEYSNAYFFRYDFDSSNPIIREMSDVIDGIKYKPVGSKFKIIHYGNQTYPIEVIYNVKDYEGIKVYFDNYIKLLLFTIFLTLFIVYTQFFNKQKAS